MNKTLINHKELEDKLQEYRIKKEKEETETERMLNIITEEFKMFNVVIKYHPSNMSIFLYKNVMQQPLITFGKLPFGDTPFYFKTGNKPSIHSKTLEDLLSSNEMVECLFELIKENKLKYKQ